MRGRGAAVEAVVEDDRVGAQDHRRERRDVRRDLVGGDLLHPGPCRRLVSVLLEERDELGRVADCELLRAAVEPGCVAARERRVLRLRRENRCSRHVHRLIGDVELRVDQAR